jgi:hypothetical protein
LREREIERERRGSSRQVALKTKVKKEENTTRVRIKIERCEGNKIK